MRVLRITLLTLLVGSLGAEVAVRLMASRPTPELIQLRAAQAMSQDGPLALHCFPSDPRDYFEVDLRDSSHKARFDESRLRNFRLVDAVPHCNEAHYNSWGLREREVGPRPPGIHRAVVLGSAVVEGFGLREADTLSRLIEAELRDASWEVFSCAQPLAPGAALASPLERCLGGEPDIVLLAFSPVDVDRSEQLSSVASQLFGEVISWQGLPSRRFKLVSALSVGWREARLARALDTWYRNLFGEPNKRGWLRTKRRIREIRERVEERGARFTLVTWPLLPRRRGGPQPFDRAHRLIAEFARARDISHVDLWPTLRQLGAADGWIHPLDARPSAMAIRLAATRLAAAVE